MKFWPDYIGGGKCGLGNILFALEDNVIQLSDVFIQNK